jgi:hypothetical protein
MAQIKFAEESLDAPWMVYISEEACKRQVREACEALAVKAIMDLIQVACVTAQAERESFVEALEKLMGQHERGDYSLYDDLQVLLKEVKAAV